MNAFFAANNLSNNEKEDILKQHRTLYDGYRVMQNKVSNEQPLYVQDFAKDKVGAVMNNKGVTKPYTNFGINEQYFNNIGEKTPLPNKAKKQISKIKNMEEVCDECGVRDMFEGKGMCSECGGMMKEGECSECGWKGEVGAMEEGMCSECGGTMNEGECSECGYKMEEMGEQPLPVDHMEIDEKTGHLDDIYKVKDLGDNEFDYVEGGGNKYGTFEKMHHMKKLKSEQVSGYEDDDNEDDGFEDLQAGEELDEGGFTGGGNAPDMDLSNIKSAYNFKSDGPELGDEPYEMEADDMDLDNDEVWEPYNFETGGATAGGDAFPQYESECEECYEEETEYEPMESAWLYTDQFDEANDVSGVQGVYGDMEPAFDFDSKGPGSAGPYQHSSWGEGEEDDTAEDDMYWQKDLEPGELDLDLTKFNPEDKSWEEIKAYTGNWDEIDEDLQESFILQKNKIMEMMNRMKVIK